MFRGYRSLHQRQALPLALLLLLGAAILPVTVAAQEVPFTDSVLPADTRVVRDLAYGPVPQQCMDIYLPRHPDHAPVNFMVHGGAWCVGDKRGAKVVDNKVARWVSKGFIFISTNYRLLPDAMPLEQAQDVAHALASAQTQASGWGGDPTKFIAMGHSAGAHLVALLGAAPDQAYQVGAKPWLGTILLDSAARDIAQIMERSHYRFYDHAFGKDPAYWQQVSSFNQLALKVLASVLKEDLSHRSINQQLGSAGRYTDAVEASTASLDPSVAERLSTTDYTTVTHQHEARCLPTARPG